MGRKNNSNQLPIDHFRRAIELALESYHGVIWRNGDLIFYNCWNEMLQKSSDQRFNDLGLMNECFLLIYLTLFLVT
ncbi:unnamed protein product [Hymenolepis diminuta]|uniref:Uncharacterized protein n=1 Tax=Hymenolepis diminuta TaxID=6216 RepID=A0A0R3SV79_HYMDI|nr:unnamed protein product [Hymenolepis diminuta]